MGKLKQLWENKSKEVETDVVLETSQERIERHRSIRIIYFTMFLMSLGFSIVLTGVWPYLDKLDPHAGKSFMGLIVAANPLGQMLFSPLIGWWTNKAGSMRLPMLATVALFTVASGIYSSLHLFYSYRKYWMVWARFLVGVSSANIAASRAYVSAATKLSERTTAISLISLAQVLGFVVGPAFQAAFTPLGRDGIDFGPLRFDMFTACGWINVILGLLNYILFLPFIFKERKIAAKEAMVFQGMTNEKDAWKSTKPNYLSCWTLIVAFFVLVFNFVLIETLATSLSMDQFAWSKEEALKYLGIMMSICALSTCLIFFVIGPLTKVVKENTLLLWGGFFLTTVGSAFSIPWGPDPPKLAISSGNSTDAALGCPVDTQEWCAYTPALTFTQFLLSYSLVSVGYPLGVTMIQTLFSKILGPRPQGVWMGFLTGAGCLSRVIGPIFVTYVYSYKGTTWTFGITTSLMIVCMIWIQIINDKLVPAVTKKEAESVPLGGDNC